MEENKVVLKLKEYIDLIEKIKEIISSIGILVDWM